MGVFDEAPPPTGGSRIGRKLILLAGVIVARAAAWMTWSGRDAPEPPRTTHATRPAPPTARPRAGAGRPSPSAAAPEAAPAVPASPPAASPAREASLSTGVLRVRSDVPGASVFLDRKYLGTTP